MKNVLLSRLTLCFYAILSIRQCFEPVAAFVERHEFSTLTRTARATSEKYDEGNCTIPERPNFGRWIISGNSYGYSSQIASLLTVIRLSCDDGYLSTSKNEYIVCEGSKWDVTDMPKCLRKCGPLKKTTKVQSIKCFDTDNTEIECEKAIHSTRVSFRCTPYFGSAEPISVDAYCYEGIWNIPDPVCPGCILPEHPEYGQWSVLGDTLGQPSQVVPLSTVLEYRCKDDNMLSLGSPFIICGKTGWSSSQMPTCLKKCRPLNSTKHTIIKCFNARNIEIKCNEAKDGDYASFECAPYFEPSDGRLSNRFCNGGTWSHPDPLCQPICGEKAVSAQPLIANGQTVPRGSYPWAAIVYHKKDDSYQHGCGGTMLSQKIILTVAHCVTNFDGDLLPTENLQVAMGKYYREYKDPRDIRAQYSTVSKIIIPESYKGEHQRYASDIAVLITAEKFVLSPAVQPVCYQGLRSLRINMGDVGVVTGWGYTSTTGHPSEELQELDVPYKTPTECEAEIPKNWFNKYYTFDKFCAGHHNQSKSACAGDSGAGLYFKHNGRYYVHGVLSTSPRDNNEGSLCNIQVNSLYTSVQKHFDWLERVTSSYT